MVRCWLINALHSNSFWHTQRRASGLWPLIYTCTLDALLSCIWVHLVLMPLIFVLGCCRKVTPLSEVHLRRGDFSGFHCRPFVRCHFPPCNSRSSCTYFIDPISLLSLLSIDPPLTRKLRNPIYERSTHEIGMQWLRPFTLLRSEHQM